MTRLRKRLAAEHGFTLVELMMAAVIGSVIMLAAYGLLDATIRSFASSGHRTDVAQRGRLMLDRVTSQLRSPVCLEGNTSAVLEATATSIKFWSDTTGSDFRPGAPRPADLTKTYATNPQPVVRELSVGGGVLTETTRDTPTGSVTQTQRIGDRLTQVDTTPYFRYWALEPILSPPAPRRANVPLTPPVATADLSRIARITVAFRVGSEDGNAQQAADFDNEVYLRSIDQANVMGAIRCG
jgi:prepilin-type N-terminal cleavage/methylation domain-containing protein